MKKVQKTMKRIQNNNDKLFNSCNIIKIDGAAFACNGLYEKIPKEKSLIRCIWKLRMDSDDTFNVIRIFFEDNYWKFSNAP